MPLTDVRAGGLGNCDALGFARRVQPNTRQSLLDPPLPRPNLGLLPVVLQRPLQQRLAVQFDHACRLPAGHVGAAHDPHRRPLLLDDPRERHAQGRSDDIDHLGNRRIRTVGELVADQIRVGLGRMARGVRERMLLGDPDTQARWYYELKKQWNVSLQDKAPFVNTLAPATLESETFSY